MSESVSSSGARSVAVVGGGVIGLAIGWRLAQAGVSVDVFERGRAGRGASWAAAGMLAAGVETEPGEEPLLALTRRSQALWPDFAQALEAASGIEVGYRAEGTLVVAATADDAARLRHVVSFQRALGIPLDWLTPAEVRAREPHLAPGIAGAVLSAADRQVDNRRVVEALAIALVRAGGRLHEEAEATLDLEGGRVTGVIAADRRYSADLVVLAAGPWSHLVPGLPPAVRPPVRPVKGQMLAVRMDPANPLLNHVLWAPKAYLVPRRDGRLLVGATTEDRGFDDRLTAGGVMALLEGAWRVLPAIEEAPIDELWVGHRPGSPDDAPILGPCGGPSGIDGLVLATGHHRNGILLAPVTADAIARLAATGVVPDDIRAFAPDRFQTIRRAAS